MKKIVPLVSLMEVDNYVSNGVDAVLMGTYFSSTRQVQVYDIEEMVKANEKIEVIALFNRFFFEQELEQAKHELKSMYDNGIEYVLCTDMGIIELIHELDIDMKVIYDTDTTMTNIEDIKFMLENGVHEVVLAREITLEERLDIAKNIQGFLGTHFFGYQLMSTSRRKHLSQYKDLTKIDLNPDAIHFLREKKRDEYYLTIEDQYGTHIYAPKPLTMVHTYPQLKEAGINNIYFEVMGANIDDVLFVVRNLDHIEDYQEFEEILKETSELDLDHGLLYKETEKGKTKS